MSTAEVRVPLELAARVARDVRAALAPCCERIEVAGSIRRDRPDVGDIELVTVPAFVEDLDGLWGTVLVNRLTIRLTGLIEAGTLAEHPDDPKRGERYSKVLHPASGLQVDVFSATPETFGIILLIRTGPADYSQWLVSEARRHGLHVAEGQLHRGGLGCGAYECEVVPTPEEADVYRALGLQVVPPAERGR